MIPVEQREIIYETSGNPGGDYLKEFVKRHRVRLSRGESIRRRGVDLVARGLNFLIDHREGIIDGLAVAGPSAMFGRGVSRGDGREVRKALVILGMGIVAKEVGKEGIKIAENLLESVARIRPTPRENWEDFKLG